MKHPTRGKKRNKEKGPKSKPFTKPKVHHKGAVEQSCSKPPHSLHRKKHIKKERDGKLESVKNLTKPLLAK